VLGGDNSKLTPTPSQDKRHCDTLPTFPAVDARYWLAPVIITCDGSEDIWRPTDHILKLKQNSYYTKHLLTYLLQ